MPKLYYYKSFRYNILMEHAAGGALLYICRAVLAGTQIRRSRGVYLAPELRDVSGFSTCLFVSEAFARPGKWLRNISALVPWAELRAFIRSESFEIRMHHTSTISWSF